MRDANGQPVCLVCGKLSPSEGEACSDKCFDVFIKHANANFMKLREQLVNEEGERL